MTKLPFSEVLDFWFQEIGPQKWFAKDPSLDLMIHDRFARTHSAAMQCELFEWRKSILGRLAEIIVLDQFSRNLFRSDARAFASDSLALALAQEAVHSGEDQKLTPEKKAFLYMPYMHSESILIHQEALRLYSQPGLEFNLEYEKKHLEILERFGRYPHRNQILGRVSTPEEIEFLKQPGSSF